MHTNEDSCNSENSLVSRMTILMFIFLTTFN